MIHFIRRHGKKIRDIGTGLFLYESFNFAFDFLFYPFALWYWGLVLGSIILVVITLAINMAVFALYEYMAIDWLGAHALRQLEDKENKTNIEKMMTWIGKKKISLAEKIMNPLVFIALTLPIDPVIIAVHYRKQHFKGLTGRDWGILILATFFATAWWLFKIGLVVEGARYLWYLFM